MVKDMASQNFFQPVSSWISRMCEAVHLTGGPISSSQTNLNNSEPRGNSSQGSDYNSAYEQTLDESPELPHGKPPLVVHTSDAESWTSTDEDEESTNVQKSQASAQITQSRNSTPHGPEKRQAAQRNHEDSSCLETNSLVTEDDEDHINRQINTLIKDIETASLSSLGTVNDLDVISYQSYNEDGILVHSGAESEAGELQDAAREEEGSISSRNRQITEEGEEMETGFSNNGFEDQNGTDSSPTVSPEEQGDVEPHAGHVPISKCGDLDITLDYKASSQKLTVTVVEAKDIPDKDRSGVNTWQVHVVLLPSKKQRGKTAIQKGPQPSFNETFTFNKLEMEEMGNHALRFRLYAVHKMIRERMMGEKLFSLKNIRSDGEIRRTLVLEPRSNLSSGDSQISFSAVSPTDSALSSQSLSHGGVPELLVGLSYNAITGRLSVQMIKGSHFRNLAINRPPDTYGKLSLLNSVGHELSCCKTSVRKGQPNPVYKETFIFQVALFQLTDVTLMISIYNRRTMKRKEMIGWISLGQNSSGEEEQIHWLEMKESKGQEVCRWHTLLEA